MSPTGGQGAAMAFEGAIILSHTLALLNTKKSNSQDPLKKWQTARQKRATNILQITKGGDMRNCLRRSVLTNTLTLLSTLTVQKGCFPNSIRALQGTF
ncbi:uncharacterized protein Z518_05780 [Rhinocladiella mackenziei CBS 650.93]|uniref:Rhinocladiella mackenziei CBS 650.93 unplaced genomic scaffold supercont1.4, whole genome shotgun sequence n=1 Tax=Rhinocladiella mackenziei CBS 650.93 TaxID=1442369 RepID=A0A0D2IGL8_9EURO|nr:uncharacterized protein Z518_05780 [Rhinocladiella mackenziei CBS 650.93]KIX04909.1 hypothetical protein Z518_05780 [Rhinocladiella mackenziei CBS 650.93]